MSDFNLSTHLPTATLVRLDDSDFEPRSLRGRIGTVIASDDRQRLVEVAGMRVWRDVTTLAEVASGPEDEQTARNRAAHRDCWRRGIAGCGVSDAGADRG